MESIEKFQQKVISKEEMEAIKGGGIWSKWRKQTDPETGNTMQQRFTWFGLKGTKEIKADE